MMTEERFLQAGGCHCRALRYTLTKNPLDVYLCQCTDCQRLSGAAFGIGVVVPADAFTLTGTPRWVQRVLGSGRTGNRWTCGECGAWICGDSRPDRVTSHERRIVRGGTVDDTSWLSRTRHVWARSAQPWFIFPEGAAVYQTQP